MSTRESGSETWPRYASFPGDNLDSGNAPEEDDVDHRTEPPSWLSGAAAVGTGADPPDADTDGTHDGGQAFAAGNDNGDAPGYGGAGPSFGSPGGPMQGDAPDFGEITTGAHDFSGVSGGSHGYADNGSADFGGPPEFNRAPDGPPDFGATRGFADAPADAPDFGGSPSDFGGQGPADSGFGGNRLSDPFDAPAAGGYSASADGGYGAQTDGGFGGHADSGQSFADEPHGNYDYRIGGYTAPQASPAEDQFGAAPYGDPQAFQPGQENGVGTQTPAAPFPSQYPPVEPPGRRPSPSGRMTASLRTVKRPKPGGGRKRKSTPGRQAQLTVARVEPWSVMKFSFVISLVAFIVFFVAVAVLYAILSGLGVFSALQHTVSNITSSQSSGGFNLMTYLSASRVLGYTGLLGAINVVLITALSTVGSVLYNITADLAGGVEITLKETD
jgi:hypothetical protein